MCKYITQTFNSLSSGPHTCPFVPTSSNQPERKLVRGLPSRTGASAGACLLVLVTSLGENREATGIINCHKLEKDPTRSPEALQEIEMQPRPELDPHLPPEFAQAVPHG